MNNKLFKRIVAVAASAVVLSSCAFASELSNASYTAPADSSTVGTLKFSYKNNGADKVTYIAYAATKSTNNTGTDVNGTKYVLGEIVAIDQFDGLNTENTEATEVTAKINAGNIKTDNDAIVILSGDSKGTAAASAVVNLKEETASYSKDLQNVTYNGISGTVVRIYGLDATKVVTVDGTTAKYYEQRNANGELTGKIVHIACVAQTTSPNVSVATGTPTAITFGDVNDSKVVDSNDLSYLSNCYLNRTVSGRNGTVSYSLPSDLMTLLTFDTNADGKIDSNDLSYLSNCYLNRTVSGRNGTVSYSMEKLACLTK